MQNPVKWVRLRGKALWLAFKIWQVTREIRETTRRYKAGEITRAEAQRIAATLGRKANDAKAGL